jgi:hypothetical protein
VDVAAAALQLEDPGRDPVEHVPVVGDEDEPAPEGGQPGLQPGDGLHVEVVGGLVEHEEVDLLHQHPGQGDPLDLPPGQGADVVAGHAGHAQVVEDGRRLPTVLPARGAARAQVLPARGAARAQVGADRLAGGPGRQGRLLVEVADAHVPAPADGAVLGLGRPGQDPEQGRLARPVAADDAEAVAAADGDRQLLEQWAVGTPDRRLLDVDQDHALQPNW